MTAFLLGAITLSGALAALGGDGADTVHTTFQVDGMHCDGCSATIVGALKRVDGVLSASADYEQGVAEATYRPADVSPDQLKAAIEKVGYTVTAAETAPVEQRST